MSVIWDLVEDDARRDRRSQITLIWAELVTDSGRSIVAISRKSQITLIWAELVTTHGADGSTDVHTSQITLIWAELVTEASIFRELSTSYR